MKEIGESEIKPDNYTSFLLLALGLMVVGTVLVVVAGLSKGWFVLYLISLCISLIVASIIYVHAEYYNKQPWIWGICSFLFFPLAPIAYFFSLWVKRS